MMTLTQAIAHLGAVEVAPGRLAAKLFDSSEAGRWQTFPVERLAAVAPDIGEPNVLWWPALHSREMPRWWLPEQRFACGKCKRTTCDGFHTTQSGAEHYRLITADLETGAEVMA